MSTVASAIRLPSRGLKKYAKTRMVPGSPLAGRLTVVCQPPGIPTSGAMVRCHVGQRRTRQHPRSHAPVGRKKPQLDDDVVLEGAACIAPHRELTASRRAETGLRLIDTCERCIYLHSPGMRRGTRLTVSRGRGCAERGRKR